MNEAKRILQQLDNAEVIGIEILTKLVAWLAPLVTGVLIAQALAALGYGWPVAILYAVVVEGLAIAFISTAAFFFSEWWGRLPAVGAFGVAAACVVAYVLVAVPIVAVIKSFPALAWVVPVGGVLLSLLSGLIVGVRANWEKALIVQHGKPVRRKRRPNEPTKKRPTDQTPDERAAARDAANAARQPSQADYNRAAQLRAEGLTWPQVGEEIGKSSSTAKRWAAMAAEPVYVNGNGSHQ